MPDTNVTYMRLPEDLTQKIDNYRKAQKMEVSKRNVIIYALREFFRREKLKEEEK